MVKVALSLMLAEDFRVAALPLFEQGLVDALEWSFDMGWGLPALPEWAEALLAFYSSQGCLYGHGVGYSALSARWEPRQAAWLEALKQECRQRSYQHVSEHFGFMTAEGFSRGAPLPVPRTAGALRVGRDRIARLSGAAGAKVGLENLALALSPRDVEEQGAFLEDLLAPGGGFLVLDLHNLYCQAVNFGWDPEALLASYPLARVRELHLSGGRESFPASDGRRRPFRRDTHDGPVPEALWGLLRTALWACPATEVVVLERLGNTLGTAEMAADFQKELGRARQVVKEVRDGR